MDSDPKKDVLSHTKLDWFKLACRLVFGAVATSGRNFVYFPRTYSSNTDYQEWKQAVEPITYRMGKLSMTAFIDCDPEQKPERIWLFFGGNGALALDWLPLTTYSPMSGDAFILVDYPGFGDSEGKPSQKLIASSIDILVSKLSERYSVSSGEIADRFFVMGHSLGAAIALETANRHGIKRGILISPFTSIDEMAKLYFGKILPMFLGESYDNQKALADIAASSPGSMFHIIHGVIDSQIPVAMAQDLHKGASSITTLSKIPEADHNDIIMKLSDELGIAITNGGHFQFKK